MELVQAERLFFYLFFLFRDQNHKAGFMNAFFFFFFPTDMAEQLLAVFPQLEKSSVKGSRDPLDPLS